MGDHRNRIRILIGPFGHVLGHTCAGGSSSHHGRSYRIAGDGLGHMADRERIQSIGRPRARERPDSIRIAISRVDNWTLFAPLAIHVATPLIQIS